MKTLKFKCTLLSDIVLNEKSASQGANSTLDFIPGNNFLGIVAKRYSDFGEKAMTIFHSGSVRFGDAHLGARGKRSLKIPASMFYPKLSAPEKECYIYHCMPMSQTPVQLKQCRQGFYIFTDKEAVRIHESMRFAIKSAYDRDARRSADEMMYGYESMSRGAELYFDVETDDDSLSDALSDALCGIHRIGRSRTAQYGLVRIEPAQYDEVPSKASSGLITIYADARLIFVDADGAPILQPTPEQLGVRGGRIAWDKCQIRKFEYSPWNFKRQCFDTDRCGIEKGSVFVVEGGSLEEPHSQYVGSYRNEGFGRVIYNPSFLEAQADGSAICKIRDGACQSGVNAMPSKEGNSVLLAHLKRLQTEDRLNTESYSIVNNFVSSNGRRFCADAFAAQWGSIRAIVTRCNSKREIMDKLFAETTGYLMHGKAKEKWDQYSRSRVLENFVNTLTDTNAVTVMINLASEMGKLCKRGKEDKK